MPWPRHTALSAAAIPAHPPRPPAPHAGAPLPWRGLQAPFIYDVYRGLRAKGVQGFFTWSLEDSAKQGFAAEGTMQQMP